MAFLHPFHISDPEPPSICNNVVYANIQFTIALSKNRCNKDVEKNKQTKVF